MIVDYSPYSFPYGRDPILPADLVLNVPRKERQDETNYKLNYKESLFRRLSNGYKAAQARQIHKNKKKINYEQSIIFFIFEP